MVINTFPYKIGRFYRTVKHLRVTQIYFRVLYKFRSRKLIPAKNHQKSVFKAETQWPEKRHSILSESKFVFLNTTRNIDLSKEWQSKEASLLWMYNLHYFDGLMSPSTPEKIKEHTVENWIDVNADARGVGWQPYPSSLRIVNWIKWDWQKKHNPISEFRRSLAMQVSHLFLNLEFHLLGNHLLENAKALIFAGCYFEGSEAYKWLLTGLNILDRELEEQILDDGGHFELSPMYHTIIFELVLDVLALSKHDNAPLALQARCEQLSTIASKMSSWLLTMVHPDGSIPYFNDAAQNLSLDTKQVQEYWESLGGAVKSEKSSAMGYQYLADSGYIRLDSWGATLFFDVAEIGPSYLPGHGHADALSVELTLLGSRVFGNLGTSVYGNDQRRSYERSTAAHSTLEFKELSSSETWGGFRVGRRAKVQNIMITSAEDHIYLQAEHTGYKHLKGQPIHKRIIRLSDGVLSITDDLVQAEHRGMIRYHLHPSVRCVVSDDNHGQFILEDGRVVYWEASSVTCSVVKSKYANEFGLLADTTSLELRQVKSKSELKMKW